MFLKEPLTFDKQVLRLKEKHNLIIEDHDFAIRILKKVSYYRLSGYGIGLKKFNSNHYIDGISINHLFKLYCFDSELKHKIIRTIEQIEIELRTQLAYHLSIKYGADVLYNKDNFLFKRNKSKVTIYSTIITSLNKEIDRHKYKAFVIHHIEKYNNLFPLWVSIELFTFNTLSALYNILKPSDQKTIAQYYNTTPMYLRNWLLCLVEVRNICAHHERFYNLPLKYTPKLYADNIKYLSDKNKVFPILLIIKRLLNSNEQWKSLLNDIKSIFNKYDGYFKLEFMGFPNDWETVLSN